MVDRLVIILFLLHGASCLDSLRFLAVGDWGGLPTFPYETPVELAVAKQMADVTNTYHTSFNLALGDNFYFDGVKDVDDKRFKETFEHVFHYESLMNPWYLVAGNHDHNGNVSAQIAYSNRSERWNFPSCYQQSFKFRGGDLVDIRMIYTMSRYILAPTSILHELSFFRNFPDYYYALSFKIPGGGVVDIVMIDTVLLCGNTDDDVVGDQPHGPSNARVSDDQWSWIDLQLQSSKADFLLVAGHFPVYSIAEHGPTDCLIDRLKPMLYKYGVTAYLSGHDHNLQHINSQENGKTVDYFVTGAGNFVDASEAHKSDIPSGTLKYHWAEIKELGGFSYLEVTPNNMTMTFVNGRRTPLYTYTLFPRK